MDRHRLSEEQLKAVGAYVERRRLRRNLTITDAAKAVDLSPRKWSQVEAGTNNHQERTLRLVAKALGEPPGRLLELAGYPHDVDEHDDPGPLDELRRRIEALEPLPLQVAALRAEVREMVMTVRSVHHGTTQGT